MIHCKGQNHRIGQGLKIRTATLRITKWRESGCEVDDGPKPQK
jgi:hypothetical protein